MKQENIDKLTASVHKKMLHLEKIMEKLEIRSSNGFMDDLAEAMCQIPNQDLDKGWKLYRSGVKFATELVLIKLEEKIKAEYLSRTTADDSDTALKEWAKKAARDFVCEKDGRCPITNKLDVTVEEQVYETMTKQLGYD
jgi:hypothetical protein